MTKEKIIIFLSLKKLSLIAPKTIKLSNKLHVIAIVGAQLLADHSPTGNTFTLRELLLVGGHINHL